MQCWRCKTIFSYEKTEGICPKCAAYNRPGGRPDAELIDKKYNEDFGQKIYPMNEVHQDLHKKYDTGKDVHKTRADIYQAKEQPSKNNLAKGILAGVIILIVVFGVAGVVAFYSMNSKTEVEVDQTIEVIQADAGAVIDIGGQLASFSAARVIDTEQTAGMLPEGISVQEIGTVYQGMEAEGGYRFYYIISAVRNNGKASADSVYDYFLTFYKNDGDSVIDVTPYPETDCENPFSSGSQPCIPSGETAVVQQMVQIRDGVESITGDFYNYYRDKPTQYTIDIPEI